MKEPHSKGDSLPKPEPRPLWGGEEAGTGSAWQGWGGTGDKRAELTASDAPLFMAGVFCRQAKLNSRMFLMSKQRRLSPTECLLDNNSNNKNSLACRTAAAHNVLQKGS